PYADYPPQGTCLQKVVPYFVMLSASGSKIKRSDSAILPDAPSITKYGTTFLRPLEHALQGNERPLGEILPDLDLGTLVSQREIDFLERVELHERAIVAVAGVVGRGGDQFL